MTTPPLLQPTSVTLSVISATAVLFIITFIYLNHRHRHRHRHRHLYRLPIVGHLHHILLSRAPPHQTLAHISAVHGPLLRLQLGQVPTVLLSSPGLARLALKSPLDHHLSSRPRLLSSHHLSFSSSDITFSPSGPYWRQARRLCLSHLLSPHQLPRFHHLRLQQLHRMISGLAAAAAAAGGGGGGGYEREAVRDGERRAVRGGVRGEVFGGGGGRLAGVLEETQRLFGGSAWGISFRGWSGASGGLEREEDFLDVLLRVQMTGDLEVPITDDNVKALVLDMFVAGTDTTATTLEWAMTELMRHPTILAKAQAEVRSMVTTSNTTTPQVSDLHHLKYMKAIIKETLRLHPPAPLLVPRESISECTIEGFKIPPKTRVLINAYAIGRDPETWPEPLEFKPERFEGNENIDVKGNEFDLIPFGGGRRGCPGYSFGLATIEIALAKLLCHFDWSLVDGVKPEDVDMSEIFGLATRKKVPLVLVPSVNKEFEWKGEA
ncbi:hypothetical protein Scep_021080 [Stephania cephalantha]|uniref:Cytochrome P450 n=1 Tax=Stephania cephalantha TaxID=152367 RepID=A0AAP0I150_9MAGN